MITTVTCSIRRGHLTKNAGTHFCTLHSTVLHKYSLKRVKIYRIFFYEQFKKVFNFYFLKQRHVYRIVSKHLLCVCVCVYIYIYMYCVTQIQSQNILLYAWCLCFWDCHCIFVWSDSWSRDGDPSSLAASPIIDI